MLIIKKKGHSNGTRHQLNIKKNLLAKNSKIVKILAIKHKSSGGRNNTGRITISHKGGGCKILQHNLNSYNSYYRAIVVAISYSAKTNTFLDLSFDFKSKKFFKSINIKGVTVGSLLNASLYCKDIKLGFRTAVKQLPIGSIINNINVTNRTTSKYSRSAGSFCQIMEKKNYFYKIRLPSGALKSIPALSFANLGVVSNEKAKQIILGKAGRNRLKGIRPSTRGIAMNPADHPHGGKSNKGMTAVTPWGLPTKNKRTSKKKYE
jgi:large subunit ribosomal protein L2